MKREERAENMDEMSLFRRQIRKKKRKLISVAIARTEDQGSSFSLQKEEAVLVGSEDERRFLEAICLFCRCLIL